MNEWKDHPEAKHIISLGAGAQSSCKSLMAAHGEITPMPIAAVFADTGDESRATYDWLQEIEGLLPFPVIRAARGESLSQHVFNSIDTKSRVSNPPLFTKPDNPSESEGLLTRDCTKDFKVSVIQREVRKLMNETGASKVIQWIGISLDESQRMKPSRVQYSVHRWPLIELRMTRHDCFQWMKANGYPEPPRSACVYCPHHSNAEWRRIRDEEPESWRQAVEFDARIRRGIHKVKADCFVHRQCVPLDQVDLRDDADKGQGLLWGNECEGMCGV